MSSERSLKEPAAPTSFITEVGSDDGEVWAGVMVDAPTGWTFEVPGRRDEFAASIELTMIRKGRA